MSKQARQWLVILGAPYLLIGLASDGHGFLLLPLGGLAVPDAHTGKIMCATAVYLWCVAGLIGFGPQ